MICLIALAVFAVCGIFSAKYRSWAKEAFDCVFRRITLRPCNTAFDKKVQAKIVGKMLQRNVRAAAFINKYFELISWIFTIIMIVSLIYSAIAVYNLVVHGTCDPVNGECVFKPGEPVPASCSGTVCTEKGCSCKEGTCEAPTFEACNGKCDCNEGTCEGKT